MTEGNIYKHVFRFVIPLMISGVLQNLYYAIDTIVVGRFVGPGALAAVGSSGPTIGIMTNLFMGLSAATNVAIGQKIGSGNKEKITKPVHTAVALAGITGICLCILGVLFSHNILGVLKVPADVIDLSSLYMKIYFLGFPGTILYACSGSILQAAGDSLRPTVYVFVASLTNCVLNLLFVAVFGMGVAGVAAATAISQYVPNIFLFRTLTRTKESFRLEVKKIKIHKEEAKEMIRLAIPSGIQTTMISMSNVIVQTSVNQCGSVAMAGSVVANNLEGIMYIALYSFFNAAVTFTSQNYGANKLKRIKSGFWRIVLCSLTLGIILSQVIVHFSPVLMRLYTDKADVLAAATQRISIVSATYVLCGLTEVGNGALRGLGKAKLAAFATLVGECGVRVVMTYIASPINDMSDLNIIFWSFPVSWVVGISMMYGMFFYQLRKMKKKQMA